MKKIILFVISIWLGFGINAFGADCWIQLSSWDRQNGEDTLRYIFSGVFDNATDARNAMINKCEPYEPSCNGEWGSTGGLLSIGYQGTCTADWYYYMAKPGSFEPHYYERYIYVYPIHGFPNGEEFDCDFDVDTDQDGVPDCSDGCPNDPDKIAPGQCDCGNPDTDTDEDGTADCIDECDNDEFKTEPGDCGCGNAELESIKPDADSLIPGKTIKVRAVTQHPSGADVDWSIVRTTGSANGDISPSSGTVATVYNVSGEGYLTIRGENGGCAREYTIYVGCEPCPEGQCSQTGAGKLRLKSIEVSLSMGRTEEGRLAGNLLLLADTAGPENATPAALKFNSFNSDSEVIKDGDTLRQVVSPETFVDIVVIDAYSYEVLFYALDDLGPKVGGFYEAIPGAVPITTWTIENPDASPTIFNRLRLIEDRVGVQKAYEYIWNEGLDTWSLSKGNGLQVITKKEETISGNRVVTEITEDNLGVIASKTQSTWHTFPWGDEIVEELVDPDNAALTTVMEYYEISGQNGYEHIKSRVNPDGSWIRYEYDAENRKTAEIRSWLDALVGSPAASAHAIYYDYTLQDAEDSDAPEDMVQPRLVTEAIEGNIVSKTYYVYHVDEVTNERTEIVEQCTDPSAAYRDPTNLTTVRIYFEHGTDLAEEGKIKSLTFPDGRMDSSSYEYGTYSPDGDPALAGSFVPGTGTDVREIVVHGTVSSPEGIADKTLREISIQNHVGEQLLREIQVFNGSSYERIQYTTQVYDQDGHVTDIYNSNGTHREVSWGCCNKESETDEQGITTLYSDYDNLGRLLTSTKEGVTPYPDIFTSYTYDAAGRILTKNITAGGLSLSTSSVYDTAGMLDSMTDAAGLVTQYDYASNNRIDTVTRPGGATEITERYLDGRTKSITGTGVVARYYTYGVNGDGTQWSHVNTGSSDSAMWEKTTTDLMGRTLRVEKPGYAGTETTEHFYNNLGQLERTTTTGQADTLYEYDALGDQVRSGLDIDASGTLVESSTDRISDSESVYTLLEGNWWQETISKVYATDNDATATTVGTRRTQVSGLGTGGMPEKSVSIDIHGNQTISMVVIDRTNKIETRTIDSPDSDIDEASQATNGLIMSNTSKTGVTVTYTYDALGRRTGVTDPRTGISTTHYNNKGQVEYVEDAAGHRVSFTYEADTGLKASETNALDNTTRFLYNLQGQVTHTWGDAAYPVKYEYDTYGRMEKMHTYRGGSNWNQAMWPTGATGDADTTTWHYQESTGLLTSKEDALGKSVSYTYEGGRLETRTWARTDGSNPIVTTYGYDDNTGELTSIDYSDATPDIAFTYDRLGRQKTVTDASGTRTFAYNGGLQLESETMTGLFDRVTTRSYETSGVMGRSIGFNTGSDYSITYGYDTHGRFGSVSWDVSGSTQAATYSYLSNSDLIHQLTTSSGQQTTYSYEPDRNLKTQVKNELNSQLISQYDYQYDGLGRRSSVSNTGQAFAAVVSAFNLYGYDDRNELTESARYLGSDIADTSNSVPAEYRNYNYDPIGNRSQAIEDTLTRDYVSNALNQYSEIATDNGQPITDNLTYDEDGNLTTASFGGVEKSLTFNTENRLIAVAPLTPSDGDKKVEFLYDYMGRRVQKKVFSWQTDHWVLATDHLFLYDGWNLISQTINDGQHTTEKYFVWGLDLSQLLQGAGGIGGLIAAIEPTTAEVTNLDLDGDNDIDGMDANIASSDPGQVDMPLFGRYCGRADISSPVVHYYLYDANGNVGQLVNADEGSIKAHYEYDPFGNTVYKTGSYAEENPFRLSTEYADNETGLVYYGYRYYITELGRWLNRDPIGERGGLNLFAFVLNDGINSFDKLGLHSIPFLPCCDLCECENDVEIVNELVRILPGQYDAPDKADEMWQMINDLQTIKSIADIAGQGLKAGVTGGAKIGAAAAAAKMAESASTPGVSDITTIYVKLMESTMADFSFGWVIWTKIDYKECKKEDCLFSLSQRLNWLEDSTGWEQCKEGELFSGMYIYGSYGSAAKDAKECLENHVMRFIRSLN